MEKRLQGNGFSLETCIFKNPLKYDATSKVVFCSANVNAVNMQPLLVGRLGSVDAGMVCMFKFSLVSKLIVGIFHKKTS